MRFSMVSNFRQNRKCTFTHRIRRCTARTAHLLREHTTPFAFCTRSHTYDRPTRTPGNWECAHFTISQPVIYTLHHLPGCTHPGTRDMRRWVFDHGKVDRSVEEDRGRTSRDRDLKRCIHILSIVLRIILSRER